MDGHLIASIEFKSQVGSFGNNANNRAEEAIGSAQDFWTAYRDGAFGESHRPWLGYFMLLEEAPESTKPIRSIAEPHFPVFPEFRNASYARRYEELCLRLVRERMYEAACLLLSPQDRGLDGEFREVRSEIGYTTFFGSLLANVGAFLATRSLSSGAGTLLSPE